MDLRIGQGFDIHALVPGRRLVLGGVEIPAATGLLGHSDADALLHAIVDAVLGAAGLGDIGRMFPDTEAAWHGADSRILLRDAVAAARGAGWRVVNADCTVVAQRVRIAPYAEAMRGTIAPLLGVPASAVGVKGKSAEHLGFVGREEGVAAFAVVLLTAITPDGGA